MQDTGVVVLGLGNLLLSDDGVGVHVVRRLTAKYAFPDAVTLVDGGTIGLGLLPYLAEGNRVIIVDAIDVGKAPGTLIRLEGRAWATALSGKVSPHEVDLRALLGAALLGGHHPRELILWGVQPASMAPGTELTPLIRAQIEPLVERTIRQLQIWGVTPHYSLP